MSPANPDPYEDFVRHLLQHEPRVRAFLHSLLNSWDEVDDVMQNTSLVAWRKHGQFEPGTSFLNWLLTIARFEALNHRRSQARSRLVLSDEVIDLIAEEAFHDNETADRERHALEHCLEKLPPARRELLQASYQPGVRFNDIAAQTHQSVQALYKTIQRLRAALLACIEQQLKELDT